MSLDCLQKKVFFEEFWRELCFVTICITDADLTEEWQWFYFHTTHSLAFLNMCDKTMRFIEQRDKYWEWSGLMDTLLKFRLSEGKSLKKMF